LPPAPTLPATGTGIAGQLCRDSSECASGSCAIVAGYLDGVCEKAPAAVCPANTIPGDGEICLNNCTPGADLTCPGSHVCDYTFSTSPTCAAGLGCRGNIDCATGYTCDAESGTCRNTPTPGGGVVGSPCTNGGVCAGDRCRTNAGGFPQGYCTAVCQLLPDLSDTCPAGTMCFGFGQSIGIGSFGVCSDLCDASASVSKFGSCRTGYVCTALPIDPRVGFCEPN
jgi:hypothetical protein